MDNLLDTLTRLVRAKPTVAPTLASMVFDAFERDESRSAAEKHRQLMSVGVRWAQLTEPTDAAAAIQSDVTMRLVRLATVR